MSDRLDRLMLGIGHTTQYEDEGWLTFVRDHKIGAGNPLNRAQLHNVKKQDAVRFSGDFFGYMRLLGYGPECDWINLTINGMTHPSEFNETRQLLNLISGDVVREWYASYSGHLLRDLD